MNTSDHDPMVPSGAYPTANDRIEDAAVGLLLAGLDRIRTLVEQERTKASDRYRLNGLSYDEGWIDATGTVADAIDDFRDSFKAEAKRLGVRV